MNIIDMSNPLTKYPHIYKKGKILNFKKLNEGVDNINRQYYFSGNAANTTTILNSNNNLNQIMGRVWLAVHKLTSYFGISKDPSEKLSKNPSVYNRAKLDFQQGGVDRKILEEIKILLEKQDFKLKNLEQKINELQKPINREEVINFKKKIEEIQVSLKAIIGE